MQFRNTIKSILKAFLPTGIYKQLRFNMKKKKVVSSNINKKKVKVSLLEIDEILSKLDFNHDIILHSSTSQIGIINEGWKSVAKLILSKVDLINHTLIAPAFPFHSFMEEYVATKPVFNVKTSPNSMGNISNYLMNQPNVIRSIHPTHSVIALGKDAIDYTNTHHLSLAPFDKLSPFYKLLKNGGKVLMFGVGLNNVTNSRVYEDLLGVHFPLSIYLRNSFNLQCIDDSGNTMFVSTKSHSKYFSSKRDNERVRPYLIKKGLIKSYKIGNSEIAMLDIRDYTITMLEMLLLGYSVYGIVSVDEEQKLLIENTIEDIQLNRF